MASLETHVQALETLIRTWPDRDRAELKQLQRLVRKLKNRQLQVVVFGMVGRGKSALINAIAGQAVCATGVRHGTTRHNQTVNLPQRQTLQLSFIDTPGIHAIAGEEQARLAHYTARQADLIFFVVAGDLLAVEVDALQQLQRYQKPLLLVCNKSDLYSSADQIMLYQHLQTYHPDVVMVAAHPKAADRTAIITDLNTQFESLLQSQGETLLLGNVRQRSERIRDRLWQQRLDRYQRPAERFLQIAAAAKLLTLWLLPGLVLSSGISLAFDLGVVIQLQRLYSLPLPRSQWLVLGGSIARNTAIVFSLEVLGFFPFHHGLSSLIGAALLYNLGQIRHKRAFWAQPYAI